ncbi:hypothetical protein SUGI_0052510 [Cryptomeria japonica]|nr:hypothetical protein SUGI_0052510 [Cryptomeria japonica]
MRGEGREIELVGGEEMSGERGGGREVELGGREEKRGRGREMELVGKLGDERWRKSSGVGRHGGEERWSTEVRVERIKESRGKERVEIEQDRLREMGGMV